MQQTINDIMQLLPHRYPFLLIDRVLEINEDATEARVLKNVTANEPQFTGHFPEMPVMPGAARPLGIMIQLVAILQHMQPRTRRNAVKTGDFFMVSSQGSPPRLPPHAYVILLLV